MEAKGDLEFKVGLDVTEVDAAHEALTRLAAVINELQDMGIDLNMFMKEDEENDTEACTHHDDITQSQINVDTSGLKADLDKLEKIAEKCE